MPLALIVEDENLVASFVESVLQETGWDTIIADSFRAASALLADGYIPDIALVDLTLADGRTGAEVAQTIRAHAPKARVIYASAHNPQIAGPLVAGAEYLRKPYTPGDLKRLLIDSDDSTAAVFRSAR
jgi:two-component system, response regulator PdtaR